MRARRYIAFATVSTTRSTTPEFPSSVSACLWGTLPGTCTANTALGPTSGSFMRTSAHCDLSRIETDWWDRAVLGHGCEFAWRTRENVGIAESLCESAGR